MEGRGPGTVILPQWSIRAARHGVDREQRADWNAEDDATLGRSTKNRAFAGQCPAIHEEAGRHHLSLHGRLDGDLEVDVVDIRAPTCHARGQEHAVLKEAGEGRAASAAGNEKFLATREGNPRSSWKHRSLAATVVAPSRSAPRHQSHPACSHVPSPAPGNAEAWQSPDPWCLPGQVIGQGMDALARAGLGRCRMAEPYYSSPPYRVSVATNATAERP